MRRNPKVSVIIPSYNSALFLDETIQSVLNQTFTDYELIIVDDCSKDNTDEVVSKYLVDNRIQYHKNTTNLGLAGNWNKALSHAKGDYIKFLMSDDKFHPLLLEKFVAVLDEHSNVSLVTSYREQFGAQTDRNEPVFTHVQKGKKIIFESLKEYNWIGEPTSVMFRRSNLWLGNFNTDLIYYIDWEMWIRHLSIGDCYIIPEILSYFRVHEQQVSQIVRRNLLYYCDNYYFYKSLKKIKNENVDFSEIGIDQIIKEKAADCIKGIVKLIPRLHRRQNRVLFQKVLKIIQMEKVPFPFYVKAINNSGFLKKLSYNF